MAFEIYYRKEKPLLMLQSIKRAWRLNSTHEHLHDCLVRFRSWLDDSLATLHPSVAAVLDAETQPMFGGRSALSMAEEYASGAALRSQAAALWGARALRRLLPDREAQARGLATALHLPDTSIQGCIDVLESLREGEFGACEEDIERYVEACRTKFPYAIAFQPPAPAPASPAPGSPAPNHVADDSPLQPKEISVNN
ncbi:N-alpha-acetyltransferase 15, NatA auxiliary subunit-like [Epargyreus clarus]|uniref:N-alpha-acetyltransferase 15, NatA auxiliary subunit-like n=1 Tax=Epargyreus clarus TaxID=520877 RepID=UPI003C2CD8F7